MAYGTFPQHQQAPPSRNNTAGVLGFVLSLAGLATCGLLSPIALLISLFGLLKQPRGFAIAGTAIGLVGSIAVAAVVGAFALVVQQGKVIVENEMNQVRVHQTENAVVNARFEVEQFIIVNDGRFPDGIDGNKLVLAHLDGWENSLRYDYHDSEERFDIRSAGPDGEFDTDDDLVYADGRATVHSDPRYAPPKLGESAH